MADLLKCPFCGGEAELRHYEDFNKDFSSVYKFYVQCKDCEVQSMPTANVERATNAWNTRKPMEEVVAELETERKTAHRTYEMYQLRVDLGRIFGMEKAIEIVRGKE